MNKETVQGNWNEIKGKIKTRWAKFTDDDMTQLEGNLDQIAGKIQKVYGFTKEKAIEEYNDFKKQLHSEESASNPKDTQKPRM